MRCSLEPISASSASSAERRRGVPRAGRDRTPGYSRPLIRVRDYLALLERSTYDGGRVR
jgi:hypothetical protein